MGASSEKVKGPIPFNIIDPIEFQGYPLGIGTARTVGTETEYAFAWPVLSGDGIPTGAWCTTTGRYDLDDPESDYYLDPYAPGLRLDVNEAAHDRPPRDVVTQAVAVYDLKYLFNRPAVHEDRTKALQAINEFAFSRADPGDTRFAVPLAEAMHLLGNEMEAWDRTERVQAPKRRSLSERVCELGQNPSASVCIDLIKDWGIEADNALAGDFDEHVGGFYDNPPCFGNVVRIGEGDYVSWARFESVLPDETERNAWYLYSNTWRDEWPEIVGAINDPERLSQMASDSIERDDAVCFMTELMPGDFTRGRVG